MEEDDEENGGFSSPLDDNDSLNGYESANEGKLRRKMNDDIGSDTDNTVKKPKMDVETNKNGKKNKDKKKDKKNGEAAGGLPGDGWQRNRVFKTFIMEPEGEKSEPIHIMEIAKLLRDIKITYQQLVQAGRNRFKVTFANPRNAEQFINSKVLTEDFKYKIYVPTMYKETIGVVRNVPPKISDALILANLETERIKITKVERTKKLQKKDLVPTYAIRIYAEGEKLPRKVQIYGLDYEVDCYVFPLKCCVKCVRYGHKSKSCKSPKVRCYNCSDEGHEGQNCTSQNVKCMHCKEEHKAFDPECRERVRQDNIRKAMAYNKLSFVEAARHYPVTSQVQYRLQDNFQFPPLNQPEIQPINNSNTPNTQNIQNQNKQTTNKNNNDTKQSSNAQSNNNNNQAPTEYITKAELEQIVHKLKVEIIKQLNVTKIINKIKEIQETIINNLSTNNDPNNKIDNHLLLLNINNQLNELVNPDILQTPKPPNKQT